ncbi:hypothetical protein [Salinisphaera sp.]
MINQAHLLPTGQTTAGIDQLMKHAGQRDVQYVNRPHQRTGTL